MGQRSLLMVIVARRADLRVQHPASVSRCLPRTAEMRVRIGFQSAGRDAAIIQPLPGIASSSPAAGSAAPRRANSLRGLPGRAAAQHGAPRQRGNLENNSARTGRPFRRRRSRRRALVGGEIDQRDVVSWPTAEITGSCFRRARTTISSLNDRFQRTAAAPRSTDRLGILPPSQRIEPAIAARSVRHDLRLHFYGHTARGAERVLQPMQDVGITAPSASDDASFGSHGRIVCAPVE